MIIPIGSQVLGSPLFVPRFAKNTALFLERRKDIKGNILMDHCGDEKYREPIKVLSRINPKYFSLVPKKIDKNNEFVVDIKRLFQRLKDEHIKTLVYSPYGDLADILRLNTQNIPQQRQGFLFTLKYKSEPYFIYDIRKVENDQ